MENWQKDLLGIIENVAEEVDRFFQGMTEAVDALLELSEEVTHQIQNTLATELDQYLYDLAEPIFEFYTEIEEIVMEGEQAFPYKEEANLQKHPACVGCNHYHGIVYDGNVLVCGMHPYGWEDDQCPDWEHESASRN